MNVERGEAHDGYDVFGIFVPLAAASEHIDIVSAYYL